MSKGKKHLAIVMEKLNSKIEQMHTMIHEVQKDIESMNNYYWENYTEMDQYGYEDFDNQRALLNQVNANEENRLRLQRYLKMIRNPFFGSVTFLYDDDEEAADFYIGIGNFSENNGCLPLIYDWRAPVSGLFYDYDKGDASYEAPGGLMAGEILSKWQYKIRDGKMIYEFESDVKIDDDILKQELGKNGDVQLKNIVRTIQKEQNAIIRNTNDKIMVIQGVAGSGKTSVALHRIAYLLYHDRERLKSSNILILSPNSVFSDYISHVLPELGEEHIKEMSFDLFAYHELKDIVADCEDRYHHIERRIAMKNWEEESYQWKQSGDFVGAVEAFLVLFEDELMNFRRFEYRGFYKSETELLQLFYFKFGEYPLLARTEAVMEYVLDEYETLSGRTLTEEELAWLREWFMCMYETTDVYKIYNRILNENGFEKLPDVPKEQRVIAYEDVYPLLYLKQRLCAVKKRNDIRHLVVDEMQDYSYLQFVILQNMFSCSMTILGDMAQTIDSEQRDVRTFLPRILGKEMRTIVMKRSYRNTVEVANFAKAISGDNDIELLERHGREVEEIKCDSEVEMWEHVLRRLKVGNDGFETAAVLVMTEKEARRAYRYLKRRRKDVYYVDRDSSTFQRGVTVTTFYMAKGLEFDQVFITGGEEENPFYQQFQYISATRALHELYKMGVSQNN